MSELPWTSESNQDKGSSSRINKPTWMGERRSISLLKLYAQFEVNSVFMNIFLGQLSRSFMKFSKDWIRHPTPPRKVDEPLAKVTPLTSTGARSLVVPLLPNLVHVLTEQSRCNSFTTIPVFFHTTHRWKASWY